MGIYFLEPQPHVSLDSFFCTSFLPTFLEDSELVQQAREPERPDPAQPGPINSRLHPTNPGSILSTCEGRSPSQVPFLSPFLGGGFPYYNRLQKKVGALILASLLDPGLKSNYNKLQNILPVSTSMLPPDYWAALKSPAGQLCGLNGTPL